ncbi:hypothetical protein GLAREA_06889 [Glarea lozoyensis ATCC 20868]|uniref:Uncharacterized protein n=1 Tax=Glarea lozoyensis (strain ATCC 20868 / MF5171) TaxID=1116229 RepID=S3DP60_GLAL2|nr:uncharacterized protein GLAREA_06889 [Glarea lozoyensis ATCC 20868]EPE33876.1 hypothetical protein GLAREA_06889 [Glarea lozoyensis ATCC 20868]
MRNFIRAVLLLSPALTLASVLSGKSNLNDLKYGVSVADHSSAVISLNIPTNWGPSHDWSSEAFELHLEVFPSADVCDQGKVTIDGQRLLQVAEGGAMTGKGQLQAKTERELVTSWEFHCVKVNGVPDSRLLRFVVNTIDGNEKNIVGFTTLFRQTGSTEILRIETDLSIPDTVIANPNPNGLQPLGEGPPIPQTEWKNDFNELHCLRTQLRELKHLIWKKEQHLSRNRAPPPEVNIQGCDSLKCVAEAVIHKARTAARRLSTKAKGDDIWSANGMHHGAPKHRRKSLCRETQPRRDPNSCQGRRGRLSPGCNSISHIPERLQDGRSTDEEDDSWPQSDRPHPCSKAKGPCNENDHHSAHDLDGHHHPLPPSGELSTQRDDEHDLSTNIKTLFQKTA